MYSNAAMAREDSRMTTKRLHIMIADGSAVMRSYIADSLQANGAQIGMISGAFPVVWNYFTGLAPSPDMRPVFIISTDTLGDSDLTQILLQAGKKHPDAHIILVNTPETMLIQPLITSNMLVEIVTRSSDKFDKDKNISFYNDVIRHILGSGDPIRPVPTPIPKESMLSPREALKLRPAPLAFRPKILAIGSSTGGPQALQTVLSHFKTRKLNLPLVITQHIPKDFSAVLAEQLRNASGLPCDEAKHGEQLLSGHIYIAPGDNHMLFEQRDNHTYIVLDQGAPENFCRPAVDPMLRSLVSLYKGNILLTILTGMGSDGALGAQHLIENGGMVLAQDEQSSVVWGMPGSVAKAGICTEILPITDIFERMQFYSMGGIA